MTWAVDFQSTLLERGKKRKEVAKAKAEKEKEQLAELVKSSVKIEEVTNDGNAEE